MGAPQNRAERGRVSVQPIYSVNQMPGMEAGAGGKTPELGGKRRLWCLVHLDLAIIPLNAMLTPAIWCLV